jgi:hypothetical protein
VALRVIAVVLLLLGGSAYAQDCPKVDPQEQLVQERRCRAAGGEWARFGVRDHLCGTYTCAPRTRDGGKRCTHRAECEYLCISKRSFPLGTPVVGECAAVVTEFGCFNYVDGGLMVGRVCSD